MIQRKQSPDSPGRLTPSSLPRSGASGISSAVQRSSPILASSLGTGQNVQTKACAKLCRYWQVVETFGGTVFEAMAINERAVSGSAFDQKKCEPNRRLIICSTPRSGSYLLARQLIRAGLGIPHEYFNPLISPTIISRAFGTVDPDQLSTASYVEWLEAHRTTPNGVFAAKLHWTHLEDNPALVDLWLRQPGTVCLFLHRKRLLSQAVSFLASRRSGVWEIGGEVTSRPRRSLLGVSDQRETDRQAYLLVMWNGLWRFLFEAKGIEAVEMAYEDFVDNQSGSIEEIAKILGVPCDIPEAETYSRSGTRSTAAARNTYLASWVPSGDGSHSLGYSSRFNSGAVLNAAWSRARRILSPLRDVPEKLTE